MQPATGRRTGSPGDDDLDARLAALGDEVRRARADAVARHSAARQSAAEPAPEHRHPLMAVGVAGAVAVAGAALGLALSESGGRPIPAAPPVSRAAPTTSVPPPTAAPPPASSSETPPSSAPMTPGSPPPPAQVLVRPGDSFWSIALSVETARLGSAPPTELVARYWSRLVAANLSRLVVTGDPDILAPGQVLVLPS